MANHVDWIIKNDTVDHVKQANVSDPTEDKKMSQEHILRIFHDLRNPLNGLYGVIQLLGDTEFPQEQEDLFEMLQLSYERMLHLVENAERGAQKNNSESHFIKETFSIRKMLIASLEPYKNRASRRELLLKHYTPVAEFDTVETDRYRLIQLMTFWTEILIAFMFRGTIEITVSPLVVNLRQGLHIQCVGRGIVHKKQVEEEYITINGMPFSKEQYDLYQQLIEILSVRDLTIEENSDSMFISFWLPARIVKTPPVDSPKQRVKQENQDSPLKKERYNLLIVEDDFLSRMTYQLALSKQYNIVFAKNGLECISLYMKNKPDLVLVDIMLPDINGFEVYERIEAYDINHPPLIACTARVLDTEASYLQSFGFKDYLPKPIQNKDLKAMLEQYLR